FLPPSEGAARVAGHDIVSDSRRARANTGYLPESAALYPEMRVREYLGYRARLEGIKGADILDRVEEIVGLCLLDEVADKKVENLSRGSRQRTALAGSLVHQPPVLILDEPTVGLDPAQIIKIRETIRSLGRERAVLLSTHILPEVDAVCDRVLIIDRGRLGGEGTPEERRGRPAGAPVVRAAFKGIVEAREALAGLPGVVSATVSSTDGETRARVECAEGSEVAEDVFRLAVSKGWVLRELSREAVSLEDVFVRLTRHDEAAPEAPEEPPPPAAEEAPAEPKAEA